MKKAIVTNNSESVEYYDHIETPVIVCEDCKITVDFETECKSIKTAINRLSKYAEMNDEYIDNVFYMIKEPEESWNYFEWEGNIAGFERIENSWYIYMTIPTNLKRFDA